MKTKKVQKEVLLYIASDGREFYSEGECKNYQKQLNNYIQQQEILKIVDRNILFTILSNPIDRYYKFVEDFIAAVKNPLNNIQVKFRDKKNLAEITVCKTSDIFRLEIDFDLVNFEDPDCCIDLIFLSQSKTSISLYPTIDSSDSLEIIEALGLPSPPSLYDLQYTTSNNFKSYIKKHLPQINDKIKDHINKYYIYLSDFKDTQLEEDLEKYEEKIAIDILKLIKLHFPNSR